jgi:hypothetical protein
MTKAGRSEHPPLKPKPRLEWATVYLSELLSNQKRLPLAEVAGYAERS